MNKYIFILIILSLWSCSENKVSKKSDSKPTSGTEYLDIPFDTNSVIASLIFNDSGSIINSTFRNNRSDLKMKTDTIDLIFMAYACDCPDWLNFNDYKKNNYSNTNLHGYYIEAADKKLIIDERLFVSGNIVRFIGREYKELCYPDNANFIDPNPPKGRVFRYYSFKFLRPFVVWGPKIFDSVDVFTGDTISYSTKLTIK